jgi:hypothetical protein
MGTYHFSGFFSRYKYFNSLSAPATRHIRNPRTNQCSLSLRKLPTMKVERDDESLGVLALVLDELGFRAGVEGGNRSPMMTVYLNPILTSAL